MFLFFCEMLKHAAKMWVVVFTFKILPVFSSVPTQHACLYLNLEQVQNGVKRRASCYCHFTTTTAERLLHCTHWSVCIFTLCQIACSLCNKLSCPYKTDGHY